MKAYLHRRDGRPVPPPPPGWEFLPEGEPVPHAHCEYLEDYSTGRAQWASPRRCRSTMTAIVASIHGGVRAVAVPVPTTTIPSRLWG